MNIRQYKKKYAICKDDNGKMIYRGDMVMLWSPMETSKHHLSRVYFNMLDGAFVDDTPVFDFLNDGKRGKRSLRDYLNQEPIPIHEWGVDEPTYKKGFCVKVRSFNKNK
jgi:hypothetical protein